MKLKHLLMKTLFVAVGLCVGQSVWADKTIGTVDSNYGTAMTGFITLQKGQSVHYVFTQDTKAEAFYHGFAVAVNKTDGTELSIIRCDNWENKDNSKSIFTNTFPEGWGSDMASFQSTVLDGATVDMTVTYSAAGIISMASTISNGVNDYTYNYTRSEAYAGTPDQVLVSLVADHAQITLTDWPVPTISVPSTFDFSNAATCSASPFNNCTWEKGTYVNAIRFAGANSVTGTAYFDSDASEDGNQPYTISSNETVTLTINAFHSWINNSKEATVSIKNSAGVELASYKYNPNPGGTNVGKIMDVKIGGTSVTSFGAFDFRSMNTNAAGANGLASSSKPYVATAANHPVISISIKGDGNVKLKFTRTLAGAVVNQEFSGTLGGDVAKNMASIVVADGINNADRAYAIQKLTITSEHNYSVTAIDNNSDELFEIASGSAPEGDNVTVPFNKYYKVGNSLLQANAIDDSNRQFSYTFEITASANEKTITYNTTSLNNVMFYSEGEDLTGVNEVEAGHIVLRGSGQKGGAGTDIAVTTLPAGKYKITACFGGKSGQTYTVKVGTDAVISETSESTLKTVTSSEIVLTESKDVSFSGGYATSTASNAHGLDYIYIQNLTDQSATLNSAGLASFSSAYPLDLSGISGATAYYAKSDGLSAGKVTLTEATGSVAAGEGLILKGENGAAVTIPVAATGTAITGNLMVGCPTGEDITSSTIDYANIYVLGASDAQLHNVKDYVDTNTTLSIPAGKAYLKASIPSGARSLTISFDDEDVTGVNEVRSQKEDVRSEWFDLQGRKVAQPAKGLYIVNGKKVVIK